MLVETLALFLASVAPGETLALAPAELFWRTPSPAYAADERAVDNWRVESALWLDLSPSAAARRALGAQESEPARCVKLNNYWCVKSAGWRGEIAADADGHVAFASVADGAAAAALLLRRYYVDYKRRSARAIVERWAPAQCFSLAPRTAPALIAGNANAGARHMLPQRVVPMGGLGGTLAPFGVQNTLRARWLAAHGPAGAAHGPAGAPARRPPPVALDLLPAPSIMAGGGEKRDKTRPAAPAPTLDPLLAAVASLNGLPKLPPLGGPGGCSGDGARIANYAAHVAEGVAASPGDDLAIFDDKGWPTDNLARVLANMAAVEIGPDRPRMALMRSAVAQLRRLLDAPPESDSSASAP